MKTTYSFLMLSLLFSFPLFSMDAMEIDAPETEEITNQGNDLNYLVLAIDAQEQIAAAAHAADNVSRSTDRINREIVLALNKKMEAFFTYCQGTTDAQTIRHIAQEIDQEYVHVMGIAARATTNIQIKRIINQCNLANKWALCVDLINLLLGLHDARSLTFQIGTMPIQRNITLVSNLVELFNTRIKDRRELPLDWRRHIKATLTNLYTIFSR